MSLLPHGNNAGANTNSMSLSDIMKLLELVKQLNDLKGELTAIPQSIVTALNSTANLLNSQGINLTTINQMNQNQITGKRALQLY